MIRLSFIINREVYVLEIDGREIYYKDRKLSKKVKLIPNDERVRKEILMSRNKLPTFLLDFWKLSKKEKEEYDNAKTEEELAEVCIKDCKTNGSKLIKREDGKGD